MASGQMPTGGSKSSKFSMVDPMAPVAGGDAEASLQQAVKDEVDKRMNRAVDDLKDRYSKGEGGYSAAHDDTPTGTAYKAALEEKKRRNQQRKEHESAVEVAKRREEEELSRQLALNRVGDSDSDDDLLDELDNDPELQAIRLKRLAEMKGIRAEREENIAKGHGRYREVLQDEFLPEVTSSKRAVAHFYHNDFERCKIMDMHLERLAPAHLECKFIKINADKAPFFVQKLQIRVLPAVLVFIDGISVSRIEGFEGLNDDMSPGKEDEWPTGNLARRLALEKAINFTAQDVMNKQRIAAASIFARAGLQEDDLSDFDD